MTIHPDFSRKIRTFFFWPGSNHEWGNNAGFVEMHFDSANEETLFVTNSCIQIYGLYSAPGRKTFRADGAYKFASPPIINQIAASGIFNEGSPPICIDKAKSYGETLSIINPYEKPTLASIQLHDGRQIKRKKIAPRSAANISLGNLLKLNESRYIARLQLTASNRVIAFHIRHSFTKPYVITDHEHMDPYRYDPTHIPAFQKFRMAIGRLLDQRFGINWHKQ